MRISDKQARTLISRVHRIEGQLRAIERVITNDDYEKNIAQLEAIFVAAKSLFISYIQSVTNNEQLNIQTKQKLLTKLIARR
ncbi:metal-sensing transcriptional repressor [Candidatus Berkelbacteria bacterium]|nr:metal-sensing transcriptional repressor [Candidatus Berkelbacteria bacterium]